MRKNDNTLAIIIIVVVAVFLFGGFGMGMMGWSSGGFGNYGMMGNMMNYMWGYNTNTGFFWPMWIFMMLIWALIVIALVLGIMWLIKQLNK